MINPIVLGLFLYFPEDKSEYLPAVIWLVSFVILAILVTRLFVVISRKQALKAKEFEEKLNQYHKQKENSQ